MHIINVLNFTSVLITLRKDNISEISASGWTYDDEGQWATMCHEGHHQSPIALSKSVSKLADDHHPFILSGYDVDQVTVKNNGHSVEIRPIEGLPRAELQGGGLSTVYQFDHFHFHWQSEHVMDNTRFPLELHFVHFAKQYGNLSNALNHPGGVAVLGVFCHLSPDDDEEFAPLTDIINNIKNAVNSAVQLPEVPIKKFFPRDLGGYYRYDGSLTTPGCNEGVIWTVFTETLPISRHQVKIFEEVRTEQDLPLTRNYRSLQERNGRTVYLRRSPIPLPPYLVNLNHGNVVKVSTVALILSTVTLLVSYVSFS